MKVIICGAGKVGTSIAKQLILEGNNVTLIDQSEELIEKIDASLDVRTIVGAGSHPDTLKEADAENADMIIAVAQSDEVNMVACQVAHSIFNIPKKIARIRSRSYFADSVIERLFSRENMPIDVMISPEIEVADSIYEKLHIPGAIESISFVEDKVKLISVKAIGHSIIRGLSIEGANKVLNHLGVNIIGFVRDQKFLTIDSQEELSDNDEIYLVVDIKDIKETMGIFGHEEKEAQKICIIGGGRIGYYLARKLEKEDNIGRVKIIERNEKRAEKISSRFDNVTVINGDALDQEILDEVNIGASDTVIAVSSDDEVNILSALLAKKSGCKRSVALVNNISFAPLFSSIGIDVIVNPREITVSSILGHIRSFKVKNVHAICDSKIEIMETEMYETSYPVGKEILELNMPTGVYICMIIRNEKIIVPNDKTLIVGGDKVIILSRVEKIKKMEKIFSQKFKYF